MKQISASVCTVLAETSPQALPLGAACIASALKKRFMLQNIQSINPFELSVHLCVFSMEEKPDAAYIARKIFETKSIIVCFSLFVWNRAVLEKTAQLLRKLWKENGIDGFIIAGGPEVTASPSSFSGNDNVFDFLSCGSGEKTIPDLVEKILSPSFSISKTAGEKRIVYGTDADIDMYNSPYLDRTLDPDSYGGSLWELARGCPFKCSYCYESKGSKKVSYFPMERIMQEIDFFAQKKVRQIFVLDPTYNADTDRALRMLHLIKEKLPHTFFHFECRAEFLTPVLAKAFASIPCSLQIGLQSADEKVLSLVNRTFNKKEFTRKIAMLNESGAVFGFDLMYGLPGDTLGSFKDSIDYAISLQPNHLELFRLSVLPGTDLRDRALELGLEYDENPPYLVRSTPSCSEKDLHKAEQIAKACTIFYSQGKAVTWFVPVIKPLKISASKFFENFGQYMGDVKNKDSLSQADIEKLQIDFIKKEYSEKKLLPLLSWAADMICLYSALARYESERKDTQLALHYPAESLLNIAALDGPSFCRMYKPAKYSVKVSHIY